MRGKSNANIEIFLLINVLIIFTPSSYSSTDEIIVVSPSFDGFPEGGYPHFYDLEDFIFDLQGRQIVSARLDGSWGETEIHSGTTAPGNLYVDGILVESNDDGNTPIIEWSYIFDSAQFSLFEDNILDFTTYQTSESVLRLGPTQLTIVVESYEPQTTPIQFSITSSAAGYEAFGIDCDISLNSDDNCGTPGDLNNQQAVYVASSTIVGSQKVVTIGYASDQPNLTGIAFDLNFDSSKLSLFSVTNVFTGAIASGDLIDSDTLHFAWASVFGQFPGANEVNLATLTFDIVGYEPPTQPQQVISINNTPKGVLGRTSILEVAYDTTDNNNQLSGLGMRVHFDSSLLSFKEITGLIEQDIIVSGEGPFSDDNDFDNDSLTDQYMLFGWASLYNNWPNTELPTVLMNIAFDVSENIDTNVISSTNINFTDTSFTAGYEFSAESYELEILNATWDFDGNGQADALTDGLMMLRHLFGLRGDLVTNDAMAGNSPFDSQQVVAEIEAAMDIADIDADGELNALTDGLLLLRYLFALRDDSLTNGAVGPDAIRSSNTDIQSYLDLHMPAM